MRSIWIALLFLSLSTPTSAQGTADLEGFVSGVDRFLSDFTSKGLVDYAEIKKDGVQLNSLIDFIQKNGANAFEGANKKAYLINVYNILTIKNVIDSLPINSPLDREDFFSAKIHDLGDSKVSLDHLEKNILFKEFPDPRLHFILVCAAIGCPPLFEEALSPTKLETQLTQATKSALNSRTLVDVTDGESTVKLSELFSWYIEDFGASEKKLLIFIKEYGGVDLDTNSKITYQKYNWTLNTK